jgi:hypothetical protein
MHPATSRQRRRRLRIVACAAVVIAAVTASGCTPSPVGVYTDASGATQYEFRPDGQVYISILGTSVTGAYEANRDRILISGPQGTVVLLRKADRLQGPMGLELMRRPGAAGGTGR